MKNRTTAILLTVGSALLCGCPALIACITGGMIVAGVPFTTTVGGYTSTQPMPVAYGIGLLCLAVIFILVPIVVGVLTLRKPKEATAAQPIEISPPGEPLPPTS